MRIGIDCRLWNETGVGRYIRNLVAQLTKIDQKNDYILFFKRHEYESVITPGNNFRKRLTDVHWHSLPEQSFFLKYLYNENLDVMHFPYFSFPLLYQRPFVITIHDLILFHYPTGKASQLPQAIYKVKLLAYKKLMYHAAKHAKKIIAVSNATKEEIVTQLHADQNKIIVTYEGASMDIQESNTITSSNVDENPYFLYVGNAYPHKNLNKLLVSFAEFHKEVPQVNLILVGKEDYFYHELKRQILGFGLEQHVSILTSVPDDELVSLYQHAVALVMPSLMEGFGLPVVEAMANNCLVAASSIPALKEMCADSAIYFDPQSREDMKKTLMEIFFNQHALQEYKQKGLERVKLFSWKKMAQETLNIYKSIPPDISFRNAAKKFKRV